MEFDKVIFDRKSVRKFKNKTVSWHLIASCLHAAIQAPSSGNTQNWRFVVIRDPANIKKITQACDEQYWSLDAQAMIVVCSHTEKISRMFGTRGEALYAVQNCAAATQNLILKAHDLGLGATWIGAFDESKINDIISIDKLSRPQAVIALGYSDDFYEKARREALQTVVYFEKYGAGEDKMRGKVTPVVDVLQKKFDDTKNRYSKH
jgi:nitroreductase